MKTSFLSKIFSLALIALCMGACKDKKPHFVVEGKISDATDSTMVYLSKRTLTETTLMDSLRLGKDGVFKFEVLSPESPEYYLLTLNGQGVNLAVDSVETITVNASAKTFATDYTVQGSESSALIKDVVLAQHKLKTEIAALRSKLSGKEITEETFATSALQSIKDYKDKAMNIILSDKSGLASYFAVFQKIDDYLIFDPNDKNDIRAYQAVATRWETIQSPRSEHIKTFTLSALASIRQAKKNEDTLADLLSRNQDNAADYYNIILPDIKNKDITLSSLRGKVVILDFTAYQAEFSPAHNIELNNLYKKYKASGLEIYQVTFEPDIHAWRNAADNLPWISVRDEKGINSPLIAKFNVANFPTTFLINKDGQLVKRIMPKDNLSTEIQKII